MTVESCVFVLLHEVLRGNTLPQVSPFSIWHLLRINFAAADAIRLRRHNGHSQDTDSSQRTVATVRAALRSDLVPDPIAEFSPTAFGPMPLGALIPDISDGCDILIGNPPYGNIGKRTEVLNLSEDFVTFRAKRASEGDDIHLYFVEMMWSLTNQKHFASSLVVPLSIAFNRTSAFAGSRSAMMAAGCGWCFAFFDREPHALFGEDVKTRNAILFAYQSEAAAEEPRLGATKLIRWTSRNRAALFSRLRFTLLGDLDISGGIPKLEGEEQAKMYWALRRNGRTFTTSIKRFSSASLSTVVKGRSDGACLFVGSTAYNFLNVFFASGLYFEQDVPVSDNAVHQLHFGSTEFALAGYAVLASRLAHWLWTVEGDGFHVPRWFLEALPVHLGDFSTAQLDNLAQLGTTLWSQAQTDIVKSVNKGKHSAAFRPIQFIESRDRIDDLLCDVLNLPSGSRDALRRFTEEHILVDRSDVARAQRLGNGTTI